MAIVSAPFNIFNLTLSVTNVTLVCTGQTENQNWLKSANIPTFWVEGKAKVLDLDQFVQYWFGNKVINETNPKAELQGLVYFGRTTVWWLIIGSDIFKFQLTLYSSTCGAFAMQILLCITC